MSDRIPLLWVDNLRLDLEVSGEGTLHFHLESSSERLAKSTWIEAVESFDRVKSMMKDKGYTEGFTWVPSSDRTTRKIQNRMGFEELYMAHGHILSRVRF